jgi:hypothetical protein
MELQASHDRLCQGIAGLRPRRLPRSAISCVVVVEWLGKGIACAVLSSILVLLAGYAVLQLEAIRVAKESAEYERAQRVRSDKSN